MALTFITGRSGSGKSTFLYKKVIEMAIDNPNMQYMVIVPEQFTMAIQKEIVKLHPAHCIMNVDIISFNRLAYRVFDELGINLKVPLADTGKNMVIRRIVEQNKEMLGAFGRNYNKQGFISEIKSFISELYQYGVTPEDIKTYIDNNGDDKRIVNKLSEILIIYKEFEKFLGEKYITAEGIADMLAGVVGKSKMVAGSVICMDGFTGFTPSQMKLVERLIALAKETYVTLTIDDNLKGINETSLFYMTYKTKEKLTQIAHEAGVGINPDIVMDYKRSNENLRFLEKSLFNSQSGSYKQDVNDIVIYSMTNTARELENAAQEILRLTSNGYKYKDIAIVCGDMDEVADYAGQIFERKKIPCFIDYKKKVANNRFIEFLRATLAISLSQYSFDAMFRFIRCPLSGIIKEDADLLENYALAAGMDKKYKWARTLSSQFRRSYEGRMEKINEIKDRVWEKTKDLDKRFPGSNTVSGYIIEIRKFIEDNDCVRMLEEMAASFEQKGMYGYEKEYEKIYELTEQLLEQMEELLGDVTVELEEFIEIFEAGVEELKVGVIPLSPDYVLIGDIERSRLNSIKILFMIGTNDGVIPKLSASSNVMSEIERQKLFEQGFELSPTRRQAAFIGQFYLYSNITKPTDRLYISYSRMSDRSGELNPSFIIKHIMRIFPKIRIISNTDIYMNSGRDYLMYGLSNRKEQKLSSEWNEILSFNLANADNTQRIDMMIDAAFDDKTDLPIKEATAKSLYENRVYSISRLEKYSSCAYAHFLRYGLGLTKKDEYELMLSDMGTIFHQIMELYSKEIRDGVGWDDVTRDYSDEIMERLVKKTAAEYEDGILYSTKRNEFIVKQIDRVAKRTGWSLINHLKAGKFTPAGFEVKFKLPLNNSDDNKLIGGVIDRIDTLCEEDKTLVKVIDYKSGSRQFDVSLFKEGISMQLIVYMDAAVHGGVAGIKGIGTRGDEGKNIVPAGAFYYRFKDPVVDWKNEFVSFEDSIEFNDEFIEPDISSQLRMTGIVNSDEDICRKLDEGSVISDNGKLKSEIMNIKSQDSKVSKDSAGVGIMSTDQMETLMDYSKKMIEKIDEKISCGDVVRNPYKYGQTNACTYCDYASVCRYAVESETPFRNIPTVQLEEFLKDVEEVSEDEVDKRSTKGN